MVITDEQGALWWRRTFTRCFSAHAAAMNPDRRPVCKPRPTRSHFRKQSTRLAGAKGTRAAQIALRRARVIWRSTQSHGATGYGIASAGMSTLCVCSTANTSQVSSLPLPIADSISHRMRLPPPQLTDERRGMKGVHQRKSGGVPWSCANSQCAA